MTQLCADATRNDDIVPTTQTTQIKHTNNIERANTIGNFSVSEMRTIMAEHFGALALPVGEFLALEHGTEFVGYRRITVGCMGWRSVVCSVRQCVSAPPPRRRWALSELKTGRRADAPNPFSHTTRHLLAPNQTP